MRRTWLILVIALFAAQAADLPALGQFFVAGGGSHGCAENCPADKGSTDDCSDRCPACPCAPHGTPLLALSAIPRLPDLGPSSAGPAVSAFSHSQAHPRAIFHPPASR